MIKTLNAKEQFQYAKSNYTNWLAEDDPDENLSVKLMMTIHYSSYKEEIQDRGVDIFMRGDELFDKKNYREAIPYYIEACKIYPMYDAFYKLSMSYFRIEQYTYALGASVNALSIATYLNMDDELPELYFRRGMMMANLLNEAMELSNANYPMVHFALINLKKAKDLGLSIAGQNFEMIMESIRV
jgi:tetratricopeptide (TPR) repeat protein